MKLYKIASWVFLIVVPIVIVVIYFFQRQENVISFHFGGIVLSIMILLVSYNRVKEWQVIKRTAKETADNLGKASHKYNPLLMNAVMYLFISAPFGLLLWFSYLIKHYDGKIELPIVFILISFFASMVLRYMADIVEQKKIAEKELEREEAYADKLAEKIKSMS